MEDDLPFQRPCKKTAVRKTTTDCSNNQAPGRKTSSIRSGTLASVLISPSNQRIPLSNISNGIHIHDPPFNFGKHTSQSYSTMISSGSANIQVTDENINPHLAITPIYNQLPSNIQTTPYSTITHANTVQSHHINTHQTNSPSSCNTAAQKATCCNCNSISTSHNSGSRSKGSEPSSSNILQLVGSSYQVFGDNNLPPAVNRRKRKVQNKATLQSIGATRLFTEYPPTAHSSDPHGVRQLRDVTNIAQNYGPNIAYRSSQEARSNRKLYLQNKKTRNTTRDEGATPIVEPTVPSHDANERRSELYDIGETTDLFELGQPSHFCRKCTAIVWFAERPDKSSNNVDEGFSICCMKGKVHIPYLEQTPPLLVNLINGSDQRSSHFLDNIRAYNSMFAFTSIGGKLERHANDGGGPPQFIISGQNCHRIGSLMPEEGGKAKFAQMYVYDTRNESQNRVSHFSSVDGDHSLDLTLVKDLTRMVDVYNPYAQSYRRARDYIEQNPTSNCYLKLIRSRSKDARMHNTPTCDEVAALIIGDDSMLERGRDIICQKVGGGLTRLHETHTSFIPLQYPLLFPRGEDGFKEDIEISDTQDNSTRTKRVRVSLREWIAFRIHERECELGRIVKSRRLYQQFLVDTYTMIESQRLSYIRANQKDIRSDLLCNLQDAMTRGELDTSMVGKRVVLPPSFTGGARYMFNNCQDAMGICKRYGYPDLFITITCNSNWNEIKDFVLARNLQPSDRPDIVCRVFKMKLDQLLADLRKGKMFGAVDAIMYTVEFQKRGLPHAHLLLWLNGEHKLKTSRDIDKLISAELPDPTIYPKLAETVQNFMIHGPCGFAFPKSPCMSDKKCSKYFPKSFHQFTNIDDDGYPRYRRRDTGLFVEKKGVKLDNRNVVPYNPQLLMRYQGHVNVEYCNKSNSIKYLFKYVNKGPDRATLAICQDNQQTGQPEVIDEIKQFYDCRYVSPCEAVWRTFAFDIHHHWPPVQRLTFHLPNQQRLLFRNNDSIKRVVNREESSDTMFLAWFAANTRYAEGRNLTYAEFPSKFVYDHEGRFWRPRKKGISIGRLNYVPPGVGELYYMRILLTVQRGCQNFNDLKKVNEDVQPTFQEACALLGLLTDDKEFIDGITEASTLYSGHQMRRLFVSLLSMNTMSAPDSVWNSTWKLLADGIVYDRRRELHIQDLNIGDGQLKNLCLIEIEKLLQANGRSLKDYSSMPFPDLTDIHQFENRLIADELNYDRNEMSRIHYEGLASMTDEQKVVYEKVMDAVMTGSGALFFLDGFGGSGKTFCWSTLSAAVRSEGLIVINVASSGIAALLLPGGKTAHSTFAILLAIDEDSTCNITIGSPRANLLIQANVIIWDEAPMTNRFCFEAFDRTLRDIMSSQNPLNKGKVFGGKVVILGGDFRQILPVIRKGSRQDIVGAAVNSSKIWESCHVMRLTKNMRLQSSTNIEEQTQIAEFANWILQIGDGKGNGNENGELDVDIPEDLLIKACPDPLQSLVDFAYPGILQNMNEFRYFQERCILAPTLDAVQKVNEFVLSSIPGDDKTYLSSDSVCKSDEQDEVHGEWFTTEFLNEIKCSGIPGHELRLKVGVPVILMRNIDQAAGLCNGTRLVVTHLGTNVIGATVITGTNVGDKILVPRMNLIPTDSGLPFKFQRRQFPLSLCFAMTINKSQGQSLSHVGLYLQRPVFTHGQLYVALSRVRSKNGLKILIIDEDEEVSIKTKNIVYPEVFENL